MTLVKLNSFQDIKSEVLERITTRTWPPGELIPNEELLAVEFGCSRATVNRALRELSESGLLERKRKAGTRVVLNPVRKATLSISIIRDDIEKRGCTYGYVLLERAHIMPPLVLAKTWGVAAGRKMLHLKALHLSNSVPYAYEDRWINTEHIPRALEVDFSAHNANEWLVQNAPFTHGDIAFSAVNADARESEYLDVRERDAVFVMDRKTWHDQTPITTVRVLFAPGHRMHTTL
ncbi:MAG: UTRA domain-containing protein [Amylibacter sp.]|nr:UTRA domain-containing protein [Amylibacter sp.]